MTPWHPLVTGPVRFMGRSNSAALLIWAYFSKKRRNTAGPPQVHALNYSLSDLGFANETFCFSPCGRTQPFSFSYFSNLTPTRSLPFSRRLITTTVCVCVVPHPHWLCSASYPSKPRQSQGLYVACARGSRGGKGTMIAGAAARTWLQASVVWPLNALAGRRFN